MAAESLLDHFESPRGVGTIDRPDAVAEGANPVCGDEVTATFRTEGGVVREMRFLARGCHATIAVMSRLTEWIRERAAADAARLTREDVMGWFEGFPAGKAHAADLAVLVVRRALGGVR